MPSKYSQYIPEIVLIIYLLTFFMVKNPGDPFDRVLISDGKGYYAYLPAIFIYHDLDYKFIEDYEAKYYGHNKIKDFRYNFEGKTVNTYFPGVAILMLPFFLIAHLLSLILGFQADGYSIIYQYTMGLAALFYLWVGLRFLQALLQTHHFKKNHIAGILILIAMGTNINYYVLKEGAMSHVYSFAAISAFLLFVKQAALKFRIPKILSAALLYGLIVIIRPTNGLVILLVPFVAGSASEFIRLMKNTFQNLKTFLAIVAAGGFFPFVMLLLWYMQSGHWIVYSYGENGFDFSNPYFFQILFSFEKGWFVYTPLTFLALGGLITLFRKSRFRFLWLLFFLISFVYVQSSWYCWTFTSNFGNRTFIDIYPLIGVLLGYFFLLINKNKILKYFFAVLFGLILILNSIQFYQHYKYIFPPGRIDFEIYKDSFLRMVPAARVRLPENIIISRQVFENDFEKDIGWLNYASVTDTLAFSGEFSSGAGKKHPYSSGLLVDAKPLMKSEFMWVTVSAQIFSNQKKSLSQLVIQLEQNRQHYFYKPFYMSEYNRKNKWTFVEFGCMIPPLRHDDDKLKVYFFNFNQDEFFLMDDLKIEAISLSADPADLK